MAKNVFVALEGALLSVPKAYLKIGTKGDLIIIPISVVSNLYNFEGIKKVFASEVCEYISRIGINEDFEQENGTFIKVMDPDSYINYIQKVPINILTENKQKILQLCIKLQEMYPDDNVILLSQNTVLLVYASAMNVKTQAISDKIFPSPQDRYQGLVKINVPQELYAEFSSCGKIRLSPEEYELHENEFVILKDPLGGSLIGRYSKGFIESLHFQNSRNYKPQNIEQIALTESLYAPPDIAPLVIASGVAGTGKTYAAVSAAINQTFNTCGKSPSYEKIIISTPAITDVGENLGYLPGDILQKLKPYFGGIFDALSKIFRAQCTKDNGGPLGYKIDASHVNSKLLEYIDSGLIEIQSLGFLAGHSLEKCFVIVDEAQNIDPNFFINIVTRLSVNSKLVILGDPYQVKAPGLSRKINGIVYMMETWKDEPFAWQICMNSQKSVRSPLCQRAIDIMS